jgi:hypothetical protein
MGQGITENLNALLPHLLAFSSIFFLLSFSLPRLKYWVKSMMDKEFSRVGVKGVKASIFFSFNFYLEYLSTLDYVGVLYIIGILLVLLSPFEPKIGIAGYSIILLATIIVIVGIIVAARKALIKTLARARIPYI